MRLLFYDVLYNLASFKLPSAARWAQNGITIAGSPNGINGSSLDRLRRNVGVFCADDGILYIADMENNRIVLIAPNSTTAIAIVGREWDVNTFRNPTDVFVTRTSIYVMDTWNFRVQKWSKDLYDPTTVAGISRMNGSSTDMMKLSNAYNLFVDDRGNVFVSDHGNHRVMRFPWNSTSGTNGVMVAGTGIQGNASAQLNGPSGIFVTDNGILYIADTGNHRIQKWIIGGSSGVTVAGTGTAGRELSELYYPSSVLIDSNGYMYITDSANDRILRWALGAVAGECIVACSGIPGTSSSHLYQPISMTFDSSGSLYVSDYGNNRVQKFAILTETGIVWTRYLSSI